MHSDSNMKTYRNVFDGFETEESSNAGESHPHVLTEPDVNLSIHPALIDRP